MILDIIFLLFLICVSAANARKGLFGIISGVISTVAAVACAYFFGDKIKDVISSTPFFSDFTGKLTESIQKTLVNGDIPPLLKPFVNSASENAALSSANAISGIVVSALIFILAMSLVKLIIRAMNTIFKLPILSSVNKLGGFIWGLFEAFIIMFIAAAVIGGIAISDQNGFLAAQMNSSYFVKMLYDNNILINFFKPEVFL